MVVRMILACVSISYSCFFFFNDTATTEIYTLSLHDALPICMVTSATLTRKGGLAEHLEGESWADADGGAGQIELHYAYGPELDRKSTRLNSSHANISYAVFCLKKKKNNKYPNNSFMYSREYF